MSSAFMIKEDVIVENEMNLNWCSWNNNSTFICHEFSSRNNSRIVMRNHGKFPRKYREKEMTNKLDNFLDWFLSSSPRFLYSCAPPFDFLHSHPLPCGLVIASPYSYIKSSLFRKPYPQGLVKKPAVISSRQSKQPRPLVGLLRPPPSIRTSNEF